MSISIVQWNLNGYNNNYQELLLLMNCKYPDVLCLQEKQFSHTSSIIITPKPYIGYFKNQDNNNVSKESNAFLFKRSLPHTYTQINSPLLCDSLYFKTNSFINIFMFPILLLGDIYSWCPYGPHPQQNHVVKNLKVR